MEPLRRVWFCHKCHLFDRNTDHNSPLCLLYVTMPDGAAGLCLAVALMVHAIRLHQEKHQNHQLRVAMASLQQSKSDLQKKLAKASHLQVSKFDVSNHCETFTMCHQHPQWSRPCVFTMIRDIVGLCDVKLCVQDRIQKELQDQQEHAYKLAVLAITHGSVMQWKVECLQQVNAKLSRRNRQLHKRIQVGTIKLVSPTAVARFRVATLLLL